MIFYPPELSHGVSSLCQSSSVAGGHGVGRVLLRWPERILPCPTFAVAKFLQARRLWHGSGHALVSWLSPSTQLRPHLEDDSGPNGWSAMWTLNGQHCCVLRILKHGIAGSPRHTLTTTRASTAFSDRLHRLEHPQHLALTCASTMTAPTNWASFVPPDNEPRVPVGVPELGDSLRDGGVAHGEIRLLAEMAGRELAMSGKNPDKLHVRGWVLPDEGFGALEV